MSNMFINPYTFIPIENAKPDRKKFVPGTRHFESNAVDRVSGYIKCRLSVESPLFIPNTSKRFEILKENSNCYFDEFFSYEDLSMSANSNSNRSSICQVGNYPKKPPQYPRIPGSEIRGAIRNLYEQLTNSCLSVVDEKNLPYRRTNVPKEPGILNVVTGELYEAKRCMLNTTGVTNVGKMVGNRYKTGDKVYVNKSPSTYKSTGSYVVDDICYKRLKNTWEEGYVLIGERFANKKHHDSVLICGSSIVTTLSDDDILRFEAVMNSYVELAASSSTAHQVYRDVYHQKKMEKIKILIFQFFIQRYK